MASCLPTIELPFGILAAMIFLSEPVSIVQWLGVLLILLGIVYQTLVKEEEANLTNDATIYVRPEIVLANLRRPEYISDYIRQQIEGQKEWSQEQPGKG